MSLRLMSAIVISTSKQNKEENSEKLLKQLLECIQECQKRFGGKTELATEFDSCVAALCLSLEAVFSHGLKVKPCTNQTSALKQVSDIVAQSLNINSEINSFWPFVKKHLTKHEEERYIVLKHIWTDTGRSKAWIRSTLNEKSLERYFHTLLSDQEVLKEHYEPWALLCDDEKNSMLPNMAAGLGSILFAININKPELNSGIARRPNLISNKVEPIIEAPVPEYKERKRNRKQKVARQIILFDDEDSVLSTSVPSCSSSTSLDSNSVGAISIMELQDGEKNINIEDNKNINVEENRNIEFIKSGNASILRKLSIETSGSRDSFSSNVPETLTPVNQMEIGELTPLSVEVNKNFDSPNTSDDIVEVPSDISAVLTAVESKNKEELAKKEEHILLLIKENKALKEQVKKYVSAIQMLGSDDEGVQKAIEGLDIDLQPDYKVEAKIYEKKLVQIAEMHAELMDFNVMLQQLLCKKDLHLERLKSELAGLRGPMSSDDLDTEKISGGVNIWIPSAFLTGSGSSSHHVYQVFLRAGNDEWNIYRRYAQFYALHTDLKKLDPVVSTFDFPPKKSIGKKDSSLVEDRRKRLQIYLRKVIAHWPELAHCNSRFLLEQHLVFFKDQREDLQNRKNMFSSRRANHSSGNYSGL